MEMNMCVYILTITTTTTIVYLQKLLKESKSCIFIWTMKCLSLDQKNSTLLFLEPKELLLKLLNVPCAKVSLNN
jgi:hypothetical protein